MSQRTVKKAEDFLLGLLHDQTLPKAIRNHITAEMKKTGPREAALNQAMAEVRNSSLPVQRRKNALTAILEFYRGEI